MPVAAPAAPTLLAIPAPPAVAPAAWPLFGVPTKSGLPTPYVLEQVELLQSQGEVRGTGEGGVPAAVAEVVADPTVLRSARPVQETLANAYLSAARGAPASCHMSVSLLAAIGEVESGSLRGRGITSDHRVYPPVYGPALDGNGFASIRDTDGGALDNDTVWDRAVGPMQFIPGTWRAYGTDGDGDGRADPQNVYDATASAARYLCLGGRDLATASGLRSAILSYNYSEQYLATVLGWKEAYERGATLPTTATVPAVVIEAVSAEVTPTTPAGAAAAPSSSPSPAVADTPTPAATPTVTPSSTPSATVTTPTPTPTATPSATPTPTPTATPSATPTPTPTPVPETAAACLPPVSAQPTGATASPTAPASPDAAGAPVVCPA